VNGVSITHGPPVNWRHIWTFASTGADNSHPEYASRNCPCYNTNLTWWPHTTPDFVRQDYFWDSDVKYNTVKNIGMILCGMARDVAPLAPAVSSTIYLTSANISTTSYHNMEIREIRVFSI